MKTLLFLLISFLAVYPAFAADSVGMKVKLETNLESGKVTPVGTIIIWPSTGNPNGWSANPENSDWLECNGQPIPSKYKRLREILGSNTPNYSSYFLRGMGGDSEKVFNKVQKSSVFVDDSISAKVDLNGLVPGVHVYTQEAVITRMNHAGSMWNVYNTWETPMPFEERPVKSSNTIGYGSGSLSLPVTIKSKAQETRPENVTVRYFVKTR